MVAVYAEYWVGSGNPYKCFKVTVGITLLELSFYEEEKGRNTEVTAFVSRKMAKWKKENILDI